MPLDSLPPPSNRVEITYDARPQFRRDTDPFRSAFPTKGAFRIAPKFDDNHQNAVPVAPTQAPSAPVYQLVAIKESRADVERKKNKHPLFPKRQKKDAPTFGSERPAGTEDAFVQETNHRVRLALARQFLRGSGDIVHPIEMRDRITEPSFIDRVTARVPMGIRSPKILYRSVRKAVNDELLRKPQAINIPLSADVHADADADANQSGEYGDLGPMIQLILKRRASRRSQTITRDGLIANKMTRLGGLLNLDEGNFVYEHLTEEEFQAKWQADSDDRLHERLDKEWRDGLLTEEDELNELRGRYASEIDGHGDDPYFKALRERYADYERGVVLGETVEQIRGHLKEYFGIDGGNGGNGGGNGNGSELQADIGVGDSDVILGEECDDGLPEEKPDRITPPALPFESGEGALN